MADIPHGRRLDFISVGRAAVDLYGEQIGGRLEDMSSFAKYLGGCPANIAVGGARLGLRTAMITRVGDEHMGRFVRETLAKEGVDTSHIATDRSRLTGLAILGIRDRTTFPLLFYRVDCADMAITAEDMDPAFIASAAALVVTGTHFSTPGTDAASRRAIAHARAAGTKVVLDIDYRPVLWGLTGLGQGEQRFVASENVSAHLKSIASHCDVIVGTEEEIHIAGGSQDTLEALRALRELTGALIVVKLGPQGCVLFDGAIPGRLVDGLMGPGFPVEVFNVLGAGDAFMAGLLRGWLRGAAWPDCFRIANACGALVVSRHGCAPAMPSMVEVDALLARVGSGAGSSPLSLSSDRGVAALHRATTRHLPSRIVCALAFDHRQQFERLGMAPDRITAFKALLGEAALRVAAQHPKAGAIIDDRYGADVIPTLTGRGLWLARPVERPGRTPFEPDSDSDLFETLRAWPSECVAKALVFYSAHDPEPLRANQEASIRRIQQACHSTGRDFLLEIIPPPNATRPLEDEIQDAVTRLYAIGIRPDWWKLPPMAKSAAWARLGATIRREDPYCLGVLILGLDAPEAELVAAFQAASADPSVRGFAVGRSLFWDLVVPWTTGAVRDQNVIEAVAGRYGRLIAAWQSNAEAAE